MHLYDSVKLIEDIAVPIVSPNLIIIEKGTVGEIRANGFLKDSFMVQFSLIGIKFLVQVEAKKLKLD